MCPPIQIAARGWRVISQSAPMLALFLGISMPVGAAETQTDGDEPVYFTCDFDAGDWWREWELKEKDQRIDSVLPGVAQRIDAEYEAHRGRSLRIRVDKGGHYGASLAYRFKKRVGTEPEEVFFRYYVRLASDWDPQAGGKLPGIGGTYGRAGWGGRKSNGADGWSARGLFRGRQGQVTPIGFYCYHAEMPGKYGDNWLWDRNGFSGLENNRWYCIEQQARMNTPNQRDGVLRGWVDGELVFEKTDVKMRTVDSLKIETVWINLYHGGTWTAKQNHHLYVDDVVISKRPIGPIAETIRDSP